MTPIVAGAPLKVKSDKAVSRAAAGVKPGVKRGVKAGAKPSKPYPDFPLFPHATKRWAKKIKAKLHYFGSWAEGPEAALNTYLEQRDDLHAGRTLQPKADALTVRDLANHFLTAKERQLESGEIGRLTFKDYHGHCARLVKAFGRTRLVSDLTAADFERLRAAIAKVRGPVALGNVIQGIRSVFKYGYEAGLVDKPVRFGPHFVKPAKRIMRREKNARPDKIFSAAEIRTLLGLADVQLRAMILLGVNCGLGNSDISELRRSALDLDAGLLDYPRWKTGVQRRAALWPETVEAVRAVLACRPKAKERKYAECVFLTRCRQPWVRLSNAKGMGQINAVSMCFAKLMRTAGLNGGRGFYALRHVFETVAGGCLDQPAVDRVMGHEGGDMATVYRVWGKDDAEDMRLRRVAEHVRCWLFPCANVKPDQTA